MSTNKNALFTTYQQIREEEAQLQKALDALTLAGNIPTDEEKWEKE